MVPEGTVNYRVAAQLAEFSAMCQAFAVAGPQLSQSESANVESTWKPQLSADFSP